MRPAFPLQTADKALRPGKDQQGESAERGRESPFCVQSKRKGNIPKVPFSRFKLSTLCRQLEHRQTLSRLPVFLFFPLYMSERAASSATRVKSGWSCRIEAGTAGVTGPVKASRTIAALPAPETTISTRFACMMSRMPIV